MNEYLRAVETLNITVRQLFVPAQLVQWYDRYSRIIPGLAGTKLVCGWRALPEPAQRRVTWTAFE